MDNNFVKDWVLYHAYRYLPFPYANVLVKMLNKSLVIMRRVLPPGNEICDIKLKSINLYIHDACVSNINNKMVP